MKTISIGNGEVLSSEELMSRVERIEWNLNQLERSIRFYEEKNLNESDERMIKVRNEFIKNFENRAEGLKLALWILDIPGHNGT